MEEDLENKGRKRDIWDQMIEEYDLQQSKEVDPESKSEVGKNLFKTIKPGDVLIIKDSEGMPFEEGEEVVVKKTRFTDYDPVVVLENDPTNTAWIITRFIKP